MNLWKACVARKSEPLTPVDTMLCYDIEGFARKASRSPPRTAYLWTAESSETLRANGREWLFGVDGVLRLPAKPA
eukprot:12175005-Heterocapsa_arctica.AAC.1